MKIIFLDIDGVLNFNGCRDLVGGVYFVNDDKIRLLKQIIDKTDAKIVLSSTWRLGWFDRDNHIKSEIAVDFIKLETKLKEFNIEFLSRTPITYERHRGTEIDMWLKKWSGELIESFVILDDDIDMSPYMDKLVHTSWKTGLCKKDVDLAIKILNTKTV